MSITDHEAPGIAMIDTAHLSKDLSVECRRLFLRGCRAATNVGHATKPLVNVEVWVPYEHSTSQDDDLAGVVDYGIMRDAVLKADSSAIDRFISTTLDQLATHPVVRARVEVIDQRSGKVIADGCRLIVP
ncbi:hypothetical protein [Burkholderia cenocepacia]|uniref:hypothetical protein n=2 Tax=Burkholderia TaxID=32008 RepID=UPI002B2546BF|nr:hypothetical protein [Burkholderia cenocepacia]MEB2543744.1 hypothetical protein [Burkholderia cenocepacia]